jgi:hypothetical protein
VAGWNALHFAAAEGHVGACRTLVSAGADVHARTAGDDFSALHLSSRFGHSAAVKELLALGANADSSDEYGHTPLHYAAGFGHVEAARVLVAHGATVTAKDLRGFVPAEVARVGGFVGVLDALRVAEDVGRDGRGRLLDWLTAIKMEQYYPSMLEQGFDDIEFIVSAGMSDADCDAIGVSLAGHRKKLTSLYRASEFVAKRPPEAEAAAEAEEEEEEEEEEDEEDEEEEEEESD